MQDSDRRQDGRLRRLLSLLPREAAPPGFEERLARSIAAARPGARTWRFRLRPAAAPAFALLLAGTVSVVAYLAALRSPDAGGGAAADSVAVEGRAGAREQADPEAAPALPPDGGAPPSEPGILKRAIPPTRQETPAAGRAAPGRLFMLEEEVPALPADSAGPDTLSPDTARPDTLPPDSAGAARDSVRGSLR